MTQTEALNKFNVAIKKWEAQIIFLFAFLTGKESTNNVDDFVKGDFVGGSPLLDSKGYKPRGSYFNTHFIPRENGLSSTGGAMMAVYLNENGTGDYICGADKNIYLGNGLVKCGGEFFSFPAVAFPCLLMLNQVPNTDRLRVLKTGVLIKEFTNPIRAISEGTPQQMELTAGGIFINGKFYPNTSTVRYFTGGLGLQVADEVPVSKAFLDLATDLNGGGVIVDPPPTPTTGLTPAEAVVIQTKINAAVNDILKPYIDV